jgi:hypothetical protein
MGRKQEAFFLSFLFCLSFSVGPLSFALFAAIRRNALGDHFRCQVEAEAWCNFVHSSLGPWPGFILGLHSPLVSEHLIGHITLLAPRPGISKFARGNPDRHHCAEARAAWRFVYQRKGLRGLQRVLYTYWTLINTTDGVSKPTPRPSRARWSATGKLASDRIKKK